MNWKCAHPSTTFLFFPISTNILNLKHQHHHHSFTNTIEPSTANMTTKRKLDTTVQDETLVRLILCPLKPRRFYAKTKAISKSKLTCFLIGWIRLPLLCLPRRWYGSWPFMSHLEIQGQSRHAWCRCSSSLWRNRQSAILWWIWSQHCGYFAHFSVSCSLVTTQTSFKLSQETHVKTFLPSSVFNGRCFSHDQSANGASKIVFILITRHRFHTCWPRRIFEEEFTWHIRQRLYTNGWSVIVLDLGEWCAFSAL